MNRRRVLTLSGSLLFLSGCVGTSSATRLAQIELRNFTDSRVEVYVEVVDDGKAIFEERVRLAPETDDPEAAATTIDEELPTEPGPYVIRYQVDELSEETFDLAANVLTDCTEIQLEIRDEYSAITYSNGC